MKRAGERLQSLNPALTTTTDMRSPWLGRAYHRSYPNSIHTSGCDNSRIAALAQELVGLQPDIILTGGTPPTAAVQRETRTIPSCYQVTGEH